MKHIYSQRRDEKWLVVSISKNNTINNRVEEYYDNSFKLLRKELLNDSYDPRYRPWYNKNINNDQISRTDI